MAGQVAAVATAHTRILIRRRAALLLLMLLPLAFYAALFRHSPRAIPIGGVASAFSAGGASIFAMLPARAADRRLVLAGYRPALLVLGRLAVLEVASLVIAVITAAVMIAGSGPPHPADVFAGAILVALVAVPLGLTLGALLPLELEATLVLIGLVGIQLTAESGSAISRVLPFHPAVQLLDASVAAPAAVWPRVLVSIVYAGVLLGIAWLAWLRRVAIRGARAAGRPPAGGAAA